MGNLKCKHFAPLLASIGQLPFGLACRTAQLLPSENCWLFEQKRAYEKKKRSNENVSNTANTRYIGLYTHTDYQQRQQSERGKLKNVKRQPQQRGHCKKKNQKEKKRKKNEENCVSQGKSKQHLKNITSICI